jgi:hypothetical protein
LLPLADDVADNASMGSRVPTAPIAATGLIAGYGVALASGSRPVGGLVLAGCGLVCIWIWIGRGDRRTTVQLTAAGLLAFALSHVLALAIGAWPSVLLAAAITAALCWRRSDAAHVGVARGPARAGGR